ncbi:FtsL-like putative cell division protein [Mesonia sp.]|uniref:FtsL-like putative cell division protein n=1 Tax=Mesonia sp. TaxID=1960830 RepID=UPI00175ABA00|nr:FtsL-like putative cell division protein [Mesonia sp.]HIB37627.1 S-adenosyl-methyltransferase [Mesonia sp.]HIO28109.1 S-adenosyl-methyltransferase [Flavobacteriaceae bacterium]
MKNSIYDFLKGKFLISDDALKNWSFILFCTALAIVMIACSHSAERKVHEIAKLNKEVRELRSEHVDLEKNLMQLKMESTILKKLEGTGLGLSKNPPQKIVILNKK